LPKRNLEAIAPDSVVSEENVGNAASVDEKPKADVAVKARVKPDPLGACNAVKCVATAADATAAPVACLADSPGGAPNPISCGVIFAWSTRC